MCTLSNGHKNQFALTLWAFVLQVIYDVAAARKKILGTGCTFVIDKGTAAEMLHPVTISTLAIGQGLYKST